MCCGSFLGFTADARNLAGPAFFTERTENTERTEKNHNTMRFRPSLESETLKFIK